MKKEILKRAITGLKVIIFVVSAFTMNAQENSVWVRIPSADQLGIRTENSVIRSADASVDALFTSYNVNGFKQAVPSSRQLVLQEVFEITCACDQNDLLGALAKMKSVFISPELGPVYELLFDPNDLSMAFPYDYALHLINAPAAWDLTHGDSTIIVSISDAGYDFSHPELVSKIKGVSSNIVQSSPAHGTAVAIAAAGATNNGYGKSSVGFHTSLDLRGMNYNELLDASYYGARVVNASWAASCFYSTYAQQIINEIHNNGTIIVAAAGNGSTCGGAGNLVYPASYDHVISVTSVGPSNNHERTIGNPSTTHQHNSSVDICAPGYDVALSTSSNVFTTGNGSSFAAPMVSGAISLMLAVNPCLNSEDVEMILKASADTLSNFMNPSYSGLLGAGRLDVAKAVEMAMEYSTMSAQVDLKTVCAFNEQYLEVTGMSGIAPYAMTWSNGDTGTIGLIGNPGVYTLTIRDSVGCVFFYETTVEEYEPLAITGDLTQASCYNYENGSIQLDLNGGSGEYFINWSNGSDQENLYDLSAGFYHVTVTDSKGCEKTESFEITAPEQLMINLLVQHPNEFTTGSVEAEVTGGTPSFDYAWSNGMNSENLYGLTAGVYQLTLTDANGCTTSKLALLQQQSVASIEQVENMEISVYPNPTNGIATMTFQMQEAVQVAVYTINGQRVLTEDNFNSGDQLNLTGLADGVYHIEMQLDNTIRRTKIVVAN